MNRSLNRLIKSDNEKKLELPFILHMARNFTQRSLRNGALFYW
jgi:hypothetical protein